MSASFLFGGGKEIPISDYELNANNYEILTLISTSLAFSNNVVTYGHTCGRIKSVTLAPVFWKQLRFCKLDCLK